jgi:hypothetical protein
MENPSSPFIPPGFENNNQIGRKEGFVPGSNSRSERIAPKLSLAQAIFGGGRPVKKTKEEKEVKLPEEKKYFTGEVAKFGKIAPPMAAGLKKALPDSFRSSEEAKKTMGRIFDARSGDAWTRLHTLRQMHKAVSQNRYGDPVLKGMKPEEIKEIKYHSEKKKEFLKGLESVDKRIKS